jgi:hypothetical protein
MIEFNKMKFAGVASLFDGSELKKFFKSYLYLIFTLEILIFFISFLCQLKPINIAFPWRYYLLASFSMPIILTFLLGIIVKGFNLYFFGNIGSFQNSAQSADAQDESNGSSGKLNSSLHFLRHAPYLLSLLMLIAGAAIFSQIDHILAFVGNVGEKALLYSLVIVGVLFFIAIVFGFVLLVFKYKLEKIRQQNEYKKEVMLRLGMMVTDDDRLIQQDGRIVSLEKPKQIPQARNDQQKFA